MNLLMSLPTLRKDSLAMLGKWIIDEGGEHEGVRLRDIAPYLLAADKDNLFFKGFNEEKDVSELFPYISQWAYEEAVGQMINGATPLVKLKECFPFLRLRASGMLLLDVFFQVDEWQGIRSEELLPFVKPSLKDAFFFNALSNPLRSGERYAPFASKEAFHLFAIDYCNDLYPNIDVSKYFSFFTAKEAVMVQEHQQILIKQKE